MKQTLLDKIEQIGDEVTSSSCNNGDSKLITGLLDELTELIKLFSISGVSNLACDYKGKRIVNSNVYGVEIQVYDGSEWRYLFGAKDLVSAKNAIDKLF